MISFIKFFLTSGFVTQEQTLSSRLKEGLIKKEDGFNSIWKLKIEPRTYQVDMTKDEVIGKMAKRYVDKSVQQYSYEYNHIKFIDQ